MNTQKRKAVACILDGNRRFAKKQSLLLHSAYTKGLNTLSQFVTVAHTYGYTDVIAYAFSEDNWNRSKKDIEQFFKTLRLIKKEKKNLLDSKIEVRVRFIGNVERFPNDLQEYIKEIEQNTQKNNHITLWLCVSYNGRTDILSAVNKAIQNKKAVNKETFSKMLSTKDIPDPDILIRTGGYKRLSGFLLWESEYTEFFFTNTLWPEFTETEMKEIFTSAKDIIRNKGR